LAIIIEPHTADNEVCGNHYAEFSNDYENRLRNDGAAIGEIAQSHLQLDAFRRLLANNDEAIQKALLSRERRHDMHLVAGAVCFLKTAEHSQGYLGDLLGEADVVAAKNAASPERAKISAIIRLITSTVTSGPDISVRLSRLAKTAAGLVLECDSLGIAVHLGNIAQVVDIALARSRTYFQKLVDAQDAQAGKDNEAADVGGAALAAPQAPPTTADTIEKIDASLIDQASADQPAQTGRNQSENPETVTLRVLPPTGLSEPVLPPFIADLPNPDGLKPGLIVLIGRVEGDTINVRGPITMPIADELISSLKDLALSAA
jgi:hypothetical protein